TVVLEHLFEARLDRLHRLGGRSREGGEQGLAEFIEAELPGALQARAVDDERADRWIVVGGEEGLGLTEHLMDSRGPLASLELGEGEADAGAEQGCEARERGHVDRSAERALADEAEPHVGLRLVDEGLAEDREGQELSAALSF